MAYILVVDDESKIRHILKIMLELKGHQVDQAGDGAEALKMLEERAYDLVISDIRMPGIDGLALLDSIRGMDIPCPVIFITAYATVDSAVDAMKRGAVDYITKPFEEERIILTVEKAVGISRILAENQMLRDELERQVGDMELVCVSEAMKKLLAMAGKVARKPDTIVLITGESGAGKEVIARYIHRNSPRSDRRFVAVNCAAITSSLVESVLFGHEKGAFTGADRQKKGFFEYADGGTLFLDEVGDLPLEAQAKLLRVLQDKVVQRVGGNRCIDVDLRVICATNRELLPLVNEGRFRADLYYRINVFPLHVPPLRERKEAVIPLAEHFIRKFRDRHQDGPLITQGAKRILMAHSWPGNVRELANTMERAVILAGKVPVTAEDLSFLGNASPVREVEGSWKLPEGGISLEGLERDLIRQALEMTAGNQSAAARLLGLSRSKFRTRVKQLENYR
ncbi:MAG TPA: sigma-54-dependent Fis family transcriptional regulator [Thermodesulfobacteriaceae bacterium]|nr:sigma-54-dependent Fis family transcriptional regulator [Thermodesulfobacteriaceae bacterium]